MGNSAEVPGNQWNGQHCMLHMFYLLKNLIEEKFK